MIDMLSKIDQCDFVSYLDNKIPYNLDLNWRVSYTIWKNLTFYLTGLEKSVCKPMLINVPR